MGKTLYIDTDAGISGDMLVAALIDLGADFDGLTDVMASLPDGEFFIKYSRVMKGDAECADFDVVLEKGHENHDHDMEYLYGHEREKDFKVLSDLTDLQDENEHHHDERNLKDIYQIIDACSANEKVKITARKIFEILAKTEGKVHGRSPEEVHFHEVGAVDSIADIIALAFCLDSLDIEDVVITRLTDGTGTVRCRHGIIPVPVPAVSEIASEYGIDIYISGIKGEMVTPTGAATAAAVRTRNELPASYRILKTGRGAGKRDYPTRGYLEAHIIEADRWEQL